MLTYAEDQTTATPLYPTIDTLSNTLEYIPPQTDEPSLISVKVPEIQAIEVEPGILSLPESKVSIQHEK